MKRKLLKKLSASLVILSLSLGQLTVLIPALGYNEARASENNILNVSETRNNLSVSAKVLETNLKKDNLSATKKKLGTNLLKLVDSTQLLPEESRDQLVSQMKRSKQYIGEKDAVSTHSKKQHVAHGDLVNVYVGMEPTASTNAIDSYVWEVTSRSEADHLAVALVETSKLETLASLPGVRSIKSVTRPRVKQGSVTAEGDIAMKTAQVRSAYGQQGAGIKVGVISDGVDHWTQARSSGDLPSNITVLDGGGAGGDEGTAMLEIIYDMAPGASLYFHQSGDDLLQFNSAYDDLVAAGCKIIVDDLGWDMEPWFEDGMVNTHLTSIMNSKDIILVSSAGNEGDCHYQGTYVNDGSGTHTKYLEATLWPDEDVYAALQWNDKFGQSGNDYDVIITNKSTGAILAEGNDTQDGNDDPYEWADWVNNTSGNVDVRVKIVNHNAAAAKTLELFVWSYEPSPVNVVAADSIYGHPNTKGVIAVGAIDAGDSGWDTPEYWSSQGPTTMLTEMRAKPEIMGIDNVSVTGVGGFGSPFGGTSASAPAVAAVVAQLWGAFPTMKDTQIQDALLASATDIGASGYDYVNGFGRADALRAYQLLASGVMNGSSAKAITSFTLAGQAGTINETSHTIAVSLPTGTSVTSIAPTIAVSANATISPTSGTAKNFSSPVTYTVTAQNGTTQTYTVTVTVAVAAKSSAKSITAFTLGGVAGTINETSHTIAVNLPTGTSVTSIAPTITVSAKATVSPTSGTARNFSSPVTYTVTAENGSTQSYTVTVTVAVAAKSSAKSITVFTLGGVAGTINETSRTIAVNLPTGTSVTSIAPVITVSAKATVSPTSGTARNFSSPAVYTVTAENGSTQSYTVTVTVAVAAKSSAKSITAFTLASKAAVINETSHTIAVNLPTGTSVTSIAPVITVSAKATVSPTSGTARNFSSPAVYTVTAENGSTQSYTVTVTVNPTAKSSAKSITAFTLGGVAGTINETSHTIAVNLPTGTSLTSIAPTITVSAKATVSPTSGTSRSFTSPSIYTVTAEDGSTQSYVITATVASAAQSSAKAITAFILGGKTGVINETNHSISISLPAGTNVTALVPDIYLSVKSTVSPGSGAAKNYTNPVNYIVTAENGSIQAYVVTVTVGSSSTSNGSPIGTITYSVTTSTSGSVIATLVPSETVTVTSTGGFTHTFTQNGTFTFTFTDSDGNTGTAVATVNNIDKTTPTITLSGSSTINLTTGTAYNELGAIATDNVDGSVGMVTSGSVNVNTAGTYIITYVATDTAGNVTTTTRTVKVTGINTTTSENALLTFAFKTLSPNVFGVINETNHTVLLTVPFSTNLTALVPTIRVSDGATVSPTSETAQNFSTAKTYTVTSAKGAKQVYTITVKKETINLPIGIIDGDIIQCKISFNPFAVYIVKIVGDQIYIRHIVSLEIFNFYKHLKWENLKQVNSLEPYSLSGWVRVNTGANGRPGANDKVYEVNGDQTKHWINMTAQQFLTHGGSDAAIYTVNQGELNLYKTGADVMSL